MGQLIFNKGAKNTYGGKGSLSTDGAGKLDIQIYKNEIGPFSRHIQRSTQSRLKMQSKTLKLQNSRRKHWRGKLYNTGLAMYEITDM